ncbi:transcriptional regulator [Roseobacter denitrificans]|uniref:Anti-sigma factor ChrR n=1 Tax=Roseobacter denitrificans (strain ATCC 33942 / OCh 114) TaxID=375451 RepID=Q16CA6_ROSDO|nr:ChrR family anti-sigma-E factor [Roseobacter denitrificans]ABG30387.1 anti-sigma factor ChrR [Roseobacter denitrificans OCh 114]AVL53547.1 transcriptional regulator [Roseobacter denitrificans]SFF72189.1 anti-ECFsigma factor, ChrR [Roseobacter denitrificans OCh 114]
MTDTIKHHLNDAILMAYSAGTLPEAFNLMVAAHLSLCDSCRAQAESFDALGGALLEQSADTEMDNNSFANTMDLIAGGDIDVTMPAAKTTPGVLPKPIQDYVGGDLDSIKWKPIGMGVKQAILPTSKDATARLLLIPAGTAMPDHGHKGTEMTMVLKGAFQDDDGYFARGDVEIADSDLHHTPVADIHEDCICLAVADAPLEFDRLLPKIAQRFLRI